MAQKTYPHECWMRLTNMYGTQEPAGEPVPTPDPLDAYKNFLHDTEQSAVKAIAKDMIAAWQAVEKGDLKIEDILGHNEVVACTVHEDGTITTEDRGFLRSEIFAAYKIDDVIPSSPKPA